MERTQQESCETIGQIYDVSTGMTYVTPQNSSSPVIGGIVYPEYTASEWHQMDPTRQSEMQFQPYIGYHAANGIPQQEIVANGSTYWQGEYSGHHSSIGNYSYQPHERLHSSSEFSSENSPTSTKTGKVKRKRVQTVSQRKAANIRERRRMFHLNEAFDELRKRLPAFNYEKRLSRIETLRLAMTYISFMKDISDGNDPNDVKLLKYQTAMDDNLYRAMQDAMVDTDDSSNL